MARPYYLFLLFALIAIVGFATVGADEADEDSIIVQEVDEGSDGADEVAETEELEVAPFQHPLHNIPDSADDVEVIYTFPEHRENPMRVGQIVDVLTGFSNDDSRSYNVTGIMGSLNNPFDFGYIYNFTMFDYQNQTVNAGDEASFAYKFLLDPRLEPRAFQIALTMFYETDGEKYATTFFNETVEVVEAEGAVDAKTFFTYCAGAAAAILVVVVFSKQVGGSQKRSGGSHSASADHSDDWLQGTSAAKKGRSVSPRQRK